MKKEYPLVSIVTATFNNFKHLFQSIDSVLSQDYKNIEYIIADDGSDNFQEAQIKSYIETKNTKNLRFTVLHNNINLGTVKNINLAYKKANGEYIINLSCGDVFFKKDIVTKIIRRFLSTKCDVLVTSRILYADNFKPICLLPHLEEREIIAKFKTNIDQYKAIILSRFYDMASGSSMYFSKKIIQEMNYFDERYLLWEDGPFVVKYLKKGKLEFAFDIVSIWYEEGGISSKRMELKRGDIVSTSFYKLQKDYEYFIKNERSERINLFSYSERKMIDYRNKRFLYRDSILRFFLYFIYFRQFVSCLTYAIKRRARYKRDLIEINKIL